MDKKGAVTVIVLGIIYLAALFTLVRPRSQGPALVKTVSDGLTGLIKQATGGGTF